MSNKKVSELSAATTLTGAELLCVVQAGSSVQTNYQDMVLTPLAAAQPAEIKQSSNFTAVVNKQYATTATLTITDPTSPSPTNGDAYRVRISAGTTTVGAVAYTTVGATLIRSYNSGGWSTAVYARGAANGIATLDSSGLVPIAQIPTSDIQIIFRKGTDAERQTVIFAQGEGVYTTDLKEFWIGDGTTLGGVRSNPNITIAASGIYSAPKILSGVGAPSGSVTATVGSMYLRLDGGANTTLYIKESGSGNTGWVAK